MIGPGDGDVMVDFVSFLHNDREMPSTCRRPRVLPVYLHTAECSGTKAVIFNT